MTDPKSPAPAEKAAQAPESRQQPRAEIEVNPEDLRNPLVADQMAVALPDHIIHVNGHPVAAPAELPRPPEVETREQAVDAVLGRLRRGYLSQQERLPQALGEALDLAFLLNNIDPEALRVNLPFNALQVRAGGFSVLTACQTIDEAKAMKVDAPALGRDLAQNERVRALQAVIAPAYQILDANQSQTLSAVAKQVDDGLGRAASVIKSNGALLRALAPALAIRGQPAKDAQETRGENERRDEAVRADEQAKTGAREKDPPRAAQTTTVTTQTGTAPAPSGDQGVRPFPTKKI